MDSENIAQVMEETTLTRIRLLLNDQKVKLWEPPYYNKDLNQADEKQIHELAGVIKPDLELPLPHIFQGLLMLQQNALEKLAARNRFSESGVLNLRLKFGRTLKSRLRNVEINAEEMGTVLVNKISTMVDRNPAMLKLISGGKVIQENVSLKEQGVKTSSTVMVLLISSSQSVQMVAEQRKLLEQTKEDAGRLGEKNAVKDDYYLQVADQSGRSLQLPAAEKKALIIAMSLHEKGRAALLSGDYSLAVVLLLEAESEFSNCRSDLVEQVDNFAILNLDIAWCYLMLQSVSELPNACERLDACERMFKASYGTNLERLQAIKGATGQEAALIMRLHLLQGIVAFHLGRQREARLLLQKTQIEAELLDVNEQLLEQVVQLGYSTTEARLGLRASKGDLDGAVEHIHRRREEGEEIRRKEKEERELEKLRSELGKCSDGSWINVGYYKTLLNMGFTDKVSAAALRQSNNSLNLAVQLLQEEPELIHLAAKEDKVNDEDLARLVSLGYSPEMASIALDNEGGVEEAAEALMAGEGIVTPQEGERKGKRKRKEEQEDKEAYERIKEGVARGEEDHLDIDLKLEKEFLEKYLELVNQQSKS
ncbi:NEDD8 ultimate buster 1 isoform X2 [Eurytemora carolleeae]|nr:NEDD8 ultimate buster 1 isoform X2 [Eurytemora carolleeae]|eukprot:XP_023329738.1 NEDD8 ultimate buster 1-like isoform X2 [Eurytemora affinis]